MRYVVVKGEVHGEGEMLEQSLRVFDGREWRVEERDGKAILSYGNSITLEMDRETFEELKKSIGATTGINGRLMELVEEFCEWSGNSIEEFIAEAVLERLKSDSEEIGSYGVPRAREISERAKQLSLS